MLIETIVLRNPIYFLFLILLAVGAYVTYTLNLWGPMARMANAASAQALEVGKERLREFLESSESGRQAMAMSGQQGGRGRDQENIKMDRLNGDGKKRSDDVDDLDDIWCRCVLARVEPKGFGGELTQSDNGTVVLEIIE